MESEKKNFSAGKKEHEIIYSRAIKAGKRIYYLDVKLNRKDEMFLSITESTKKFSGTAEDTQVTFEKHKIFLYNEDFDKFLDGLNDVVSYVRNAQTSMENEVDKPLAVDEERDDDEKQDVSKTRSFLDKFRF
ncbi:MAG: DUF3276 family protein [Paludibacteraceae bacterium]|nr:DUF3276 family protein [Paludibacteraceae bacterium]